MYNQLYSMSKVVNLSFMCPAPQEITFIYESPSILYRIYEKFLQIDKTHGIFKENYAPIQPPSGYASKIGTKWLFIDPQQKQSFRLSNSNQGTTIQKITTVNIMNLSKIQSNVWLEKRELNKILGNFRYQQIFKSEIDSLQIIRLKIQHNQYFSLEQITSDIKQLFNKRLTLFFQPQQLIITNFSLMKCTEDQLYKFWDFYSDILMDYWDKFLLFISKESIEKKYFAKRNEDLKKLFGEFKEYRCIGGSTGKVNQHFKKEQAKKFDENGMEQQDCIDLIENNTISLDISMKTTNFYGHFQEEKQQHPLSQQYPLINNYKPEPESRTKAIFNMMRSGFKPNLTCPQQCECFLGKIPCHNMFQKVQCPSHNCKNSQIRNKKQVFCRYLGLKNRKKALQNSNFDYTKYQVQQYHSFGLDFYTVRILYYLLPYAQRFGNQAQQNQTKKQNFISNVIPEYVTKRQSLIQAIQCLQYHKHWGYYAKILHKKLRIIQNMAQENYICKCRGIPQSYPNVVYLQSYYKGIGVRNIGKTIPKGQFIEKFVGQILQPWREWQKQTIATKISKEGYKNQDPSLIKFYCMSLQSHINEPNGVQTFSVDPQNKGNFTRSLNHSCNPNCSVQVYVSQGMYHAAVFSLRQIETNQQLTFDYMSITDNYQQYMSASCLCGNMLCTGRYLRFHQVLYNTFNDEFMRKKYPLEDRFTDLLLAICRERDYQQIQKSLKQHKINFTKSQDKSQNYWLLKWAKNAVDLMNYQLKHQQMQQIKQISKSNISIFNSSLLYEQKNGLNTNLSYLQKTGLFVDTLKKERIVSINTKISKIAHYLQVTGDFSAPIQVYTKEHILFYLKSNFESNCILTIQEFLKIKMKIKKISISEYLKNSQKYRLQLIKSAKDHFKKGNLQEASKYLGVAFTFLITKIHLYPSFKSEPVVIWRQNADPIKESLEYRGSDYTIINELLNWGDIKKQQQRKKNPKSFQLQQKLSTIIQQNYQKRYSQNNQSINQEELILYLKYLCKKSDETLFGFGKRPQIQKPNLLNIESFDLLQHEVKKINQKSKTIWAKIQSCTQERKQFF